MVNIFRYFVLFLLFFTSLCYAKEKAIIFIVFSSDAAPYKDSYSGFKELLKNNEISVNYFECNITKNTTEEIYSQIISKKPDLILSIGTKASNFIKEKIKNIPVIFNMILNPAEFIDLNSTGVSLKSSLKENLIQIKRIIPSAKRIGLLYSKDSVDMEKEVSKGCDELGLQLIRKRIDSGKEIAEVLTSLQWQIDCILMLPDPIIYFKQSIEYLLLETLKKKVFVVGLSSFYTKAGALFSIECDYYDLGKQAGEIALKILQGEKPSNIPPINPRKNKLSLNLLVAERLDIKIPANIIKQADEVYGE